MLITSYYQVLVRELTVLVVVGVLVSG